MMDGKKYMHLTAYIIYKLIFSLDFWLGCIAGEQSLVGEGSPETKKTNRVF